MEVMYRLTGDFAEDGDVAGDDGEVAAGGFDEGEAKAFAVGGGEESGAGFIDFFEVFVADGLEPKEVLMEFGVGVDLVDKGFDEPAFFADDDEVDI